MGLESWVFALGSWVLSLGSCLTSWLFARYLKARSPCHFFFSILLSLSLSLSLFSSLFPPLPHFASNPFFVWVFSLSLFLSFSHSFLLCFPLPPLASTHYFFSFFLSLSLSFISSLGLGSWVLSPAWVLSLGSLLLCLESWVLYPIMAFLKARSYYFAPSLSPFLSFFVPPLPPFASNPFFLFFLSFSLSLFLVFFRSWVLGLESWVLGLGSWSCLPLGS